MTTTAKGPVTVSNTAELRAALVAGYTADEIVMPTTESNAAALATARKEGRDEGHAAGLREGKEMGATAERDRIQAVEEAILPGHEQLIATLKYDGKTTGAEAAAQVVVAERKRMGRKKEDLLKDGEEVTATTTAPSSAKDDAERSSGQKKVKVDPNLPVEDRCKAEWQGDPDIRKEFGSLEEYTSYAKASEGGRVRVMRGNVQRG